MRKLSERESVRLMGGEVKGPDSGGGLLMQSHNFYFIFMQVKVSRESLSYCGLSLHIYGKQSLRSVYDDETENHLYYIYISYISPGFLYNIFFPPKENNDSIDGAFFFFFFPTFLLSYIDTRSGHIK